MMDIQKICENLDLSNLNCFYADVRLEDESGTRLGFKNAVLEDFTPSSAQGAFLRVYNNGHWFYKSTTDFAALRSDLEELVQQSKAFKGECQNIFATVPIGHADHQTAVGRDPRQVSLEEKRALCESYIGVADGIMQVKECRIVYRDRYQKRAFKSTKGRSFVYDFADYGVVIVFNLKQDEHLFHDYFRLWGAGFADLQGKLPQARAFLQESLKHLTAPAVAPGKYPVVMNSEVVGVFTHESFGHKSEADFMLGDQAARDEWKMGTQVAAKCVSIVDEGSVVADSGYCPVDDEGMPKTKTYLIKDGLLTGRLHSLETAHEFDEAPTGNARAINFEFEPIVRMTSTYIEPGTQTEEEVIRSVKTGLFCSGVRHGSGLSTFTIAPTRSYWIRDGKIAEPVKVAVLSGTVFETLNQISAVANHQEIHSSVFGGCGKDEQWPLRVSDGGPMILVDEMQLG